MAKRRLAVALLLLAVVAASGHAAGGHAADGRAAEGELAQSEEDVHAVDHAFLLKKMDSLIERTKPSFLDHGSPGRTKASFLELDQAVKMEPVTIALTIFTVIKTLYKIYNRVSEVKRLTATKKALKESGALSVRA